MIAKRSMVATRLKRSIHAFLTRYPTAHWAVVAGVEEVRFLRAQPQEVSTGVLLKGAEAQSKDMFEEQERMFLLERLDSTDLVVDVGANVGLYSCLAAAAGVSTIAIEPQRINVRYLLENLRLNDFRNVEVLPVAAGDRPGFLTLYGRATGASAIRGWAGQGAEWADTVPVSTLDDLLAHRSPSDKLLVKVDVEGTEYGVIRGAQKLLDRQPRPVWMIEIDLGMHHPGGVNPQSASTFREFFSRGYSCRALASGDSITMEDVERWVEAGHAPAGGGNFAFL